MVKAVNAIRKTYDLLFLRPVLRDCGPNGYLVKDETRCRNALFNLCGA